MWLEPGLCVWLITGIGVSLQLLERIVWFNIAFYLETARVVLQSHGLSQIRLECHLLFPTITTWISTYSLIRQMNEITQKLHLKGRHCYTNSLNESISSQPAVSPKLRECLPVCTVSHISSDCPSSSLDNKGNAQTFDRQMERSKTNRKLNLQTSSE